MAFVILQAFKNMDNADRARGRTDQPETDTENNRTDQRQQKAHRCRQSFKSVGRIQRQQRQLQRFYAQTETDDKTTGQKSDDQSQECQGDFSLAGRQKVTATIEGSPEFFPESVHGTRLFPALDCARQSIRVGCRG